MCSIVARWAATHSGIHTDLILKAGLLTLTHSYKHTHTCKQHTSEWQTRERKHIWRLSKHKFCRLLSVKIAKLTYSALLSLLTPSSATDQDGGVPEYTEYNQIWNILGYLTRINQRQTLAIAWKNNSKKDINSSLYSVQGAVQHSPKLLEKAELPIIIPISCHGNCTYIVYLYAGRSKSFGHKLLWLALVVKRQQV